MSAEWKSCKAERNDYYPLKCSLFDKTAQGLARHVDMTQLQQDKSFAGEHFIQKTSALVTQTGFMHVNICLTVLFSVVLTEEIKEKKQVSNIQIRLPLPWKQKHFANPFKIYLLFTPNECGYLALLRDASLNAS